MSSESGCRDALKVMGDDAYPCGCARKGGATCQAHGEFYVRTEDAVPAEDFEYISPGERDFRALKTMFAEMTNERDALAKQVTELQSRGTELVLENRELKANQLQFIPFSPDDFKDDVNWTGDGKEPKRGSELASGVDLCAMTRYLLEPGERTLISTGIRVEMPAGWEAQVRPRSSFSKKGIYTALGTIDADYRGDIGVILENRTGQDFVIEAGHRIAQLVFAPVFRPTMVRVEKLSETERGTGGWGSTGR